MFCCIQRRLCVPACLWCQVESVRKKVKELNHLRLRQCLKGHTKAGETVWVAKFSPDGQYLATAGGTSSSGVIRVWRVKGSPGVSAGLAAAVVSSIAPDVAPARAPANSGSSRESHESPISTSGSSARRPSVCPLYCGVSYMRAVC
jgi:WD40 repeat protein